MKGAHSSPIGSAAANADNANNNSTPGTVTPPLAPANANAAGAAAASAASPLPTSPVSNICILIYVDNIEDFVRRVAESGYIVYIDITEIRPGVRVAVVLDPSGIRVRLLEGDCYPFNKQKSRARLGYVSIPIKDYYQIEKSVKFYEETFHPKSNYSHFNITEATTQTANNENKTNSLLPPTPQESLELQKNKTSFRLIDLERFVEGNNLIHQNSILYIYISLYQYLHCCCCCRFDDLCLVGQCISQEISLRLLASQDCSSQSGANPAHNQCTAHTLSS